MESENASNNVSTIYATNYIGVLLLILLSDKHAQHTTLYRYNALVNDVITTTLGNDVITTTLILFQPYLHVCYIEYHTHLARTMHNIIIPSSKL